jgi:hypothetical protein
VEVSINGSLIAYQGTAGSNTLETIDFTKGWVDPRDGTYFSYYLTKDRKHYQLLWFLEEESSITSQNNSVIPSPGRGGLGRGVAQAVSYDNRIPTVYGRKLWILTNDQNTPIEQAWTDLDITAATTWYIAHMTDTEILSWSSLQSINPKASCKRIKQLRWWSSDWVYEINPTGVEDAEFDVYCDMTTDGWGWTYATMLADTSTQNLFDTWNTDKIASLTDNISSKWSLSTMWIDDNARDIMLVCKVVSLAHKSYESPMIIYDYLYSDIWHLEKQTKQWTPFSSSPLTAKYKWKKFQLWLNYAGSSFSVSHYIRDSSNQIVFGLDSWINIRINPSSWSWSDLGPSYTSGAMINILLSNTNYCMTAIR